jgi:hypothetical protein
VTISYDVVGTELVRNGEVMAEGITAVAFSYVLENGSQTSTPADLGDIRAVRMTITGVSEDKGQGKKTRTVTQLATIRN